MTLKNEFELAHARERLLEVERRCEMRRREAAPSAHVQELTVRSLKRLINQLKEEIARYEAHQPVGRG